MGEQQMTENELDEMYEANTGRMMKEMCDEN